MSRRRRGRRGQFIVMTSLGMAVLMVSFTTILVGYSVSPLRFTKSNFREVQMQAVSNFRRALAISLAEVSQQLEFKAHVKQYSKYLDLESYPQAKNLGYEVLSTWQNLTLLTYPGTGLNLTSSIPIFYCSWNSTSGMSRAGANMTLDILSYGFFGFRDSSVASLNLTILDANQTGPVTSFFFSLEAENDRPVPDLDESSIKLLYLKTDGGWKKSHPETTKIYYLGEGVYIVRFSVNQSQMSTPPEVRLFAQDSRGIAVGAKSILSETDDTVGPYTSNLLATPNPTNAAPSVTLRATVSDLFYGWSNIRSAQCVVNDSTGSTIFQGNMMAVDGSFDEISEDVMVNMNVTGWPIGNYTVSVKGEDNKGNWGNFSSMILRVTSLPKMHVERIEMSISAKGSKWKNAIAVVTILDENGQPVDGATVSAHWSGATTSDDTQKTDNKGLATFTSGRVSQSLIVTFTITITDVERSGYFYDPNANKETSDSITG